MDTATSYLGMKLAHPFIAGASPLGYSLDTIKRLEDAGCAAIVLHSLFEEQISLATEGRVGHVDPLDQEMRALVAAYPGDVATLVAHEPPIITVLPDAEAAKRAQAGFNDIYKEKGRGAGMAAFIAMSSWQGEYTDDYFAQPAPDPAAFGMPAEDDGSRDDPLLSDRSWAITDYEPDADALAAAPTRIVIAVGEESAGTFTARTAEATAALLGQEATVFPSHHGGFMGGEFGYAGQPEAFAKRLREVLGE